MEENNSKKLSTILGTVGYQCPEMLENKGYSGVENDIFAAGVILFIFVNGYPPFKDATSKDPWYKNIYFGETKKFWDLHMKRLAIKTPSFLKLIERMLAKTNRITIDEILNSEWVKGELPSKDDLFNDLKERKVIVDSNREVKNSPKIVKLKNNEGAKTNNSKQYRAGIEDTLEKIDEMVNQLDISHFKTKRIEECGYDNYQSSAFYFNGNEENNFSIDNAFKFIYTNLTAKNSELELNKNNFVIHAKINFRYNENEFELEENLNF